MGRFALRLTVIAILFMSIFLVPSADAISQPDADGQIDFIRFQGAVYLSLTYLDEDLTSMEIEPLATTAIGPVVGQVVTNWVDPGLITADPNEPCAWDIGDGTAPRLAPGDNIFAVRGYATAFRVAAQQGGEFMMYQVWCGDRARVGADLFDVYGRVERISVTGDTSETSGWAIVDDPAEVATLIGMVLEGPVIPEDRTSTAPVTLQLMFHLDDNTTFRASASPGELLWGLGAVGVPAEFTTSLDQIWQEQLTSGD